MCKHYESVTSSYYLLYDFTLLIIDHKLVRYIRGKIRNITVGIPERLKRLTTLVEKLQKTRLGERNMNMWC